MSKDDKGLNGLTPEEIIERAKQEAAEELEAKLKEKEAQAEKEKAAMIAELQAERKKRQAVEEELKKDKDDNKPDLGEDPKKVFEELLKEKEQAQAREAREKAIAEFKNSIREFSDEHDTAGIVFAEFKRELSKFNLEGLKTKEEFKQRFKEVYEFMNRGKTSDNKHKSTYEGSNPNIGSNPKEGNPSNLSDVEKRLIDEMGWTEERYLKVKAKHPAHVANLLSFRS